MNSERLETSKNLFQFQKLSLDKTADLPSEDSPEMVFPKEWKLRDFKKEVFDHLFDMFFTQEGAPLPEIMADMEKSILLRTLDRFNGNLKDTACFLGIKYTTLHQKMKKYNICFRKHPISE